MTWIEVLSPSNKPGGQDWDDYACKRLSILAAGIPLLELDYLHTQPPVIVGLPRYRGNTRKKLSADPGAKAFNIAITDPAQPYMRVIRRCIHSAWINESRRFPFRSMETITLPFDFGAVYNRTFSLSAHALLVDYEQLPAEFKTFTAFDQLKIRQRMELVALHQHELDKGPLTLDGDIQ